MNIPSEHAQRNYGPIRRNVRTCVRCEDEAAQTPVASVFALGQECLDKVFESHIRNAVRDEDGSTPAYAELVAKYGYRAPQ